MIDKDALKGSLSDNEIINIVTSLGSRGFKNSRTKNELKFQTICHSGNSYKLYYYSDLNLFHCYTGCNDTFDIFDLVSRVKKYTFNESIVWVANFVGRHPDKGDAATTSFDERYISDWKWINKIKKKTGRKPSGDIVYDKCELDCFEFEPHMDFVDDDILTNTQRYFDVRFDIYSDRIIIPIFNHLGELIGAKGRIVKAIEDQTDCRYLAILPYNKTNVLYGIHRTLPYISDSRIAIVYESEKSVMKSFQWGYKNCVALGGHELSYQQMKQLILISDEIVFAFDKDLPDEDKYYKKLISNVKPYTSISIIHDTKDLLESKDSPIDKGKEIFEELYNNRYKIG